MSAFAGDAPQYFRTGANVLPIVAGSKAPPPGVRWADWQRRRQTDEEFGRLLNAYGAEDVAITLGRGSGGLIDIETDGREGEQALRDLRLPLPPTGMFESRRGVHRLYRSDRPLRSCKGIRPKLDVLAGGAYAVVPSSKPRVWLTPGFLEGVAPLPEAWEGFITSQKRRLTGQEILAVEKEGVGDLRNVHLASLVGRWVTQLRPENEVRRLAQEWARRVPQADPFCDEEAQEVVSSILRIRRRGRSPEREAWLLGASRGLRHPVLAVFVGLVILWGELGLPEPALAASHRTVASYAMVDRDAVGPALKKLEDFGLISIGRGIAPDGRRVTAVRFRVNFGGEC